MILSRTLPSALKALTPVGLLLTLTLFPACTPHREEPLSVPRLPPDAQSFRLFNTTFQANLYTAAQAARTVFGLDGRTAGLLPVRCLIEHRGRTALYLLPQQSFLLDRQQRAWPLLTGDQVRNRLALAPLDDAARQAALKRLWGDGPWNGLAFGLWPAAAHARATSAGLLSRRADANPLSIDTRQTSVRPALSPYRVDPGQLAEAYLLFPDHPDLQQAVDLRLGLDIEGTRRAVNVPLKILDPM